MILRNMWQYEKILRLKCGKARKDAINVKVLIFDKFKEMLNIKNQTNYTLLTEDVTNATNAQEGQKMGLYTDGKKLYVREIEEFGVKFKEEK